MGSVTHNRVRSEATPFRRAKESLKGGLYQKCQSIYYILLWFDTVIFSQFRAKSVMYVTPLIKDESYFRGFVK
jgi:hypothetical protein